MSTATSPTPTTYAQVAKAVGDATLPVFYLEIPPSLFGTVVGGLVEGRSHRERARRRREAVRSRPRVGSRAERRSCTRSSTSRSSTASTTSSGRCPSRTSSTSASRTRSSSRSGTGSSSPRVQITMGEDFDVADRGHFYDPVGAMRDVVQNHLLQVLSLVAMEPPTGHGVGRHQQPQARRLRRDGRGRPVALRARPVPRLPRRRRSRARLADGDVLRACGSRSTTGAGPASRSSSAPGKSLPVTVTEVRVVFNTTPWLGFVPRTRPARRRTSSCSGSGRKPGARLRMQAKDAEEAGASLGPARHGVREHGRRGANAVRGAARRGDAR